MEKRIVTSYKLWLQEVPFTGTQRNCLAAATAEKQDMLQPLYYILHAECTRPDIRPEGMQGQANSNKSRPSMSRV